MIIFCAVIMVLCAIGIMWDIYLLIRNQIVYKVRTEALHSGTMAEGIHAHNALPSYNDMLKMYFTFKYEDFVTKKNQQEVRQVFK